MPAHPLTPLTEADSHGGRRTVSTMTYDQLDALYAERDHLLLLLGAVITAASPCAQCGFETRSSSKVTTTHAEQ